MARIAISKVVQSASRQNRLLVPQRTSPVRTHYTFRQSITGSCFRSPRIISTCVQRSFSSTRQSLKGISPESEDPKPKEAQEQDFISTPAELTNEEYNYLADEYLNDMVEKFEDLQESREDVDVEYSAGVLTLTFPPNGQYVINKQPPNKQIWLSSPLSGPKRYDFVILGDSQKSKEGTGSGAWVYLRDGSTLDSLLLKEVGVELGAEPKADRDLTESVAESIYWEALYHIDPLSK
ncbi:hypothetical protein F5884DRAFT_281972 [Xylogone sp. PMI_703]|nr:hypothetical protein F5884DRAFT_281972 [Xylogone sp. PMI_703]